MFRSRSWFGGGWNKPKNRLSLDHLKYLYSVLERNPSVTEANRSLLVESLRCIAEILIWGDQNDSSVFDFFLEKNMLSYFLHIMRQKSGGSSFVCVQLLQTLNILFENIRNETSLYYLLSNNHVNSIIVHKFDFSDEDVMGYYTLFLKTLSLKLNAHTIHFFYNEHTNDFPLYTEAIKFFNHPESMVRIAVRTITLNVYKVQNTSMLQFIRDKTAAPYFSNLVWFIGKHILELDTCVRNDTDHQSQQNLSNLVAEHLDHLHYLNDILCLDISDLNAVLTEHLLHKLFVPLYIFSLTPPPPPISMALVIQNLAAVLNKDVNIDMQEMNNPRVSCVVALFLLSLVFLVITHGPLVHALAWVILNADHSVFKEGASEVLNALIERREAVTLGFMQPNESLEQALDFQGAVGVTYNVETDEASNSSTTTVSQKKKTKSLSEELSIANITDEEKEKLKSSSTTKDSTRPFLDIIIQSLDCSENDYLALLALCLIYAFINNKGVDKEWLHQVLSQPAGNTKTYSILIIEKLLQIVNMSSQQNCRIRLVTLELTKKLIFTFCGQVGQGENSKKYEIYRNALFSAQSQSMAVLREFYKSEDIFLDLFEDEYNEMIKTNLNVEYLCMDETILLPPTSTPLTGIDFNRRLPCGEVEKARRSLRVFFILRGMCHHFMGREESMLPLTNPRECIQVDSALDLNCLKDNSDLIACSVLQKDGTKFRRFLVIDVLQLILVEPDSKRLGWGIAKLVGFLQDVEVTSDKDDSRCLHITIHRAGSRTVNRTPILAAKFLFDDHIRCMAAKQRLTKGRSKARQKKMLTIAQLLEVSNGQLSENLVNAYGQMSRTSLIGRGPREHRPLFSTNNRVPGFAAALKRDNGNGAGISRVQMISRASQEGEMSDSRRSSTQRDRSKESRRDSQSKSKPSTSRDSSQYRTKSRDPSPQVFLNRSEEIQLEDFRQSRNSSPSSRSSSRYPSRSHTPSRVGGEILSAIPREYSPAPSTSNATVVNESEETSFIAQKKKGIIETV